MLQTVCVLCMNYEVDEMDFCDDRMIVDAHSMNGGLKFKSLRISFHQLHVSLRLC